MILAIEREWACGFPGWFLTLDPEYRALLLADWQVRHKPPKTRKAKPTQIKRIGRYV